MRRAFCRRELRMSSCDAFSLRWLAIVVILKLPALHVSRPRLAASYRTVLTTTRTMSADTPQTLSAFPDPPNFYTHFTPANLAALAFSPSIPEPRPNRRRSGLLALRLFSTTLPSPTATPCKRLILVLLRVLANTGAASES